MKRKKIKPGRTVVHVRASDQSVMAESTFGFASRALFPAAPERKLDWIVVTLPPQCKTQDIELHRKGLEAYVHVLDGELIACIAERQVFLGPGDSLYFEADTRYSFENIGTQPCRYYLLADTSRVMAGRRVRSGRRADHAGQ